MRVLITGAGGFAGRHVVAHLLQLTNWKLTVVDRLPMNFNNDRVTEFVCDMREHLSPTQFGGDVSAVINLASSSDVRSFLNEPEKHVLNNVLTTMNLLQWARWQDLTVFIQVSTNEVYGPSDVVASKEWDPLVPPTPYSASKAAQEMLAFAWERSFDVPTVIVNTMHLFGEVQPAERFIPTVIRSLLTGSKIPIFGQDLRGNGQWEASTRNWMYVRDFAHALFRIINKAPYGHVERWNVAGPVMTCYEVADQIARRMNTKFEVDWQTITEARPGYEQMYTLNTQAFKKFGFVPFYGCGVGFTRTIDWFKEKINSEEN